MHWGWPSKDTSRLRRTRTQDWLLEWWADARCCLVTCVHGMWHIKFAVFHSFLSDLTCPYAVTDSPDAEPHQHWSGTVSQVTDSQSSINTATRIRGVMLSRFMSKCSPQQSSYIRKKNRMAFSLQRCSVHESSWKIHSAALTGRPICAWLVWHACNIPLGAHLEVAPRWNQHLSPCLFDSVTRLKEQDLLHLL